MLVSPSLSLTALEGYGLALLPFDELVKYCQTTFPCGDISTTRECPASAINVSLFGSLLASAAVSRPVPYCHTMFPVFAIQVPNKDIMIVDQGNNRVIEVNYTTKQIDWSYGPTSGPGYERQSACKALCIIWAYYRARPRVAQ